MKKTALLIIDMMNQLDFPEGPKLLKQALPVADSIAKLKQRFEKKKLPIVYVNDNFDEWHSDWHSQFELCSQADSRGSALAQKLKPTKRDYFILKPLHSGFISTPLELFLRKLKVKRVVVTGIAGDICVLFTAHDAHALGFEVVVPEDCLGSNTRKQNEAALYQLRNALKIPTTKSVSLKL